MVRLASLIQHSYLLIGIAARLLDVLKTLADIMVVQSAKGIASVPVHAIGGLFRKKKDKDNDR